MSKALVPMIKTALPTAVRVVKNWGIKNAPSILTAVGCVGVGTSVVMGVKATPGAMAAIDDRLWKKFLEQKEIDIYDQWLAEQLGIRYEVDIPDFHDRSSLLTKKEIFLACWKHYIPTAATAIGTMLAVTGSNMLNLKRQAALSSLLALTQSNFDAFKEKTKEMFGEKKAGAVKDAITQDRVNSAPLQENTIINTGKGNTLCFDPINGRYFYSDIESIKKSEITLAYMLVAEGRLSINDIYFELGLPETKYGNDMGWRTEWYHGPFSFEYSSCLKDDERPCLVVEPRDAPHDI